MTKSFLFSSLGAVVLLASPISPAAAQEPAFSEIVLTPGGVELRGTNGPLNGTYEVLASPDVSTPLNLWSVLATNKFKADGSFECTNSISGGLDQFYRLAVVADLMPDFSLAGFATVNGDTTGGSGGSTQTVTTATAFTTAVEGTATSVIYVQGALTIGEVRPKSNKTIIGLGTNATLLGVLTIGAMSSFGEISNIVVRNLFLHNPTGTGSGGGDGITLQYGAHHVWVDHCTFYDNPDGQLDTSHASDYLTYSWNKFYYTSDTGHNFVNLVGHNDSNGAEDSGTLRITWHHNWYGTLCVERMPRVRFGQNHIFNNYYGCTGNNYCVGVGCSSQLLVENDCFDNVSNPWKNYSSGCTQGLVEWNAGNVFLSTTIPTWAPNSTVFSPPYTYTLEDGATVKDTVTTWAGAGVIQP